MPTDEALALILTTEAGPAVAAAMAAALIERRVAACVTTSRIESTYRWEGDVVHGEEVQLVVKTTPQGVEAAIAAIEDLHSYDVPEIIVLGAAASRAYRSWAAAEVGPDVIPPGS